MVDVIIDTLLDCAKLLPFLFLTYLLMEFLEHKSGGATERWLRGSGKVGPLVGGAFGVVPQCGFSSAAAGLYAGRVITTGTLVAVCLSTSDEMLPVLIANQASPALIFKVLGIKLCVGVLAGFATDFVSGLCAKSHPHAEEHQIEDICEREHCNCGDHFALSALKHTVRVAVFILIVCFALNTAVYFVGEERIAALVLNRPLLGNLLSTLVGLIPNCASSVILTELYLGEVLSFGALLSGLLINSGVALAILFRNNRPLKDSFRVLGILFAISFVTGIVVDLIA